MRYRETGNVHKDFHLSMNTSIKYVLRNYGMETLRELFRRTAQLVYREIYADLRGGNFSSLLEHWRYFYDREGESTRSPSLRGASSSTYSSVRRRATSERGESPSRTISLCRTSC